MMFHKYKNRIDEVFELKKEALRAESTGDESVIRATRIQLLVRAKVLFDHLDESDNDVRFKIGFILGAFYRKFEMWDDSLKFAEFSVYLDDSSTAAVNSLFLTLLKMGRTSEALDVLLDFTAKYDPKEFFDVIEEIHNDYKDGYYEAFDGQVQLLARRVGILR